MNPVSCNNTLQHIIDLVNHGKVKIQKLEYLESKTGFYEIKKNSKPVPQMKHSEKLSFCLRGNL